MFRAESRKKKKRRGREKVRLHSNERAEAAERWGVDTSVWRRRGDGGEVTEGDRSGE